MPFQEFTGPRWGAQSLIEVTVQGILYVEEQGLVRPIKILVYLKQEGGSINIGRHSILQS